MPELTTIIVLIGAVVGIAANATALVESILAIRARQRHRESSGPER